MKWERQERERARAGKMVEKSSKWKNCVSQSCVSKHYMWHVCERVVCDNVVCEGAVCVCDRAVCERVAWCCMWKMLCVWKVGDRRICTVGVSDRMMREVKRLRACHECHACQTKWRTMSPSATPTRQNGGGCFHLPHLPRKLKVDVAKCHACHTEWRWMLSIATPATQTEGRCRQMPRLPHRMEVDAFQCHACHTKWRSMSPSATPAAQNGGGSVPVPRLPRKVKVDASNCHTCHIEWKSMLPTTTPAAQRAVATYGNQARHQRQPSAISARLSTGRATGGGYFQLPYLPHKMKVNVATCHARHTEWRWMLSSAMPATQNGSRLHPITTTATQRVAATNRNQARHHRRPSAISAMPATLSKGQCRQVPRLHSHGDKQERSQPSAISATPHKVKVDVAKCHACHTECTSMSPNARPKWMSMLPIANPCKTKSRRGGKREPSTPPELACECNNWKSL